MKCKYTQCWGQTRPSAPQDSQKPWLDARLTILIHRLGHQCSCPEGCSWAHLRWNPSCECATVLLHCMTSRAQLATTTEHLALPNSYQRLSQPVAITACSTVCLNPHPKSRGACVADGMLYMGPDSTGHTPEAAAARTVVAEQA